MYKVGVFPGKLCPPHRGHLNAIFKAACQCEKLYVVVSYRREDDEKLFAGLPFKTPTLKERAKWLSIELQGFDHIKVIMLDEEGIPSYPLGWRLWSFRLAQVVPEHIDVIFGSEPSYTEGYTKYFPEADYVIIDSERSEFPISATMVRNNPYKYWDYILGAARPHFTKRVLIVGTESCVDCDTEYFNGSEWKKISEYTYGEKVLQFNDDYSASLVIPDKYIKQPCDEMLMFHNTYKTWTQICTEDHDMVYITSKGNLNKKPAGEVKEKILNNKTGFGGKFINWFHKTGNVHIDKPNIELMVAISADGTKHGQNYWRIRLKKDRKIKNLRRIINEVGLPLDERIYKDGFHNFLVPKEYGSKIFPDDLLNLDDESKKNFIECIFDWDGDKKERRYFTTEKRNADIVQFILASSGFKANFYIDKRENRKDLYIVQQSNTKYTTIDCHPETDRNKLIEKYQTIDGFKYCFNVPSHMLVLRRDNHIFITGNCGKTTLTKMLAKIYHTAWAEEAGRYYSRDYLGGNEDVFTPEDFYQICVDQRRLEEDALRHANKVVFFDTEALITQYYCEIYLGEKNPKIESLIDPSRYDLVLFMTPEVKWVDDGLRFISDQKEREEKNDELYKMFIDHGFGDKMVVINGGDYLERFAKAKAEVDKLMAEAEH